MAEEVKARAVRFDHYGGRDVLYAADIPLPTPAPGEVVVAVRAAAINPGEAKIRAVRRRQRSRRCGVRPR
jgi:NADPH:quinone reductase-like Zn-dependent oxidoreductase